MRKGWAKSLRVSSKENNSQRTTAAALLPVIEFLREHAPFDRMAAAHVDFLARRLCLGFYANGELVTEPANGPARHFYIIKQGRVRGETEPESGGGGLVEEGAWELSRGECFPIGALMARRAVHTRQRAVEDTFCYELERDDFEQLLVNSPEFHDFCSRRLANLLDQVWRGVQAGLTTEVSGDTPLNARLQDIVRRAPVSCPSATPIRAALHTMNDERVGSIVVVDRAKRPLGMFTLHDVLSRVVTTDVDLDAAIDTVMTPQPEALPPHAFAFEAALLMVRRGFSHVCVVRDGRLVGVVSERDLFSLQRVGLVSLTRAVTQASDVARLVELGRDVHRLVDQLLVQGVSVLQLTQIITQLNDHLTRRVIALCLAERGAPDIPFTWLSFGSEGRREQTLKTDQDNGMLFVPPAGTSAVQARDALLPLAQQINHALAECGFPLCQGNIMASNPECCLSFEEWRDRFAAWIDQGGPEQLLKVSIFFDFRVLHGDERPVDELREWIRERVPRNLRFLRQLAENALRNRPPLGLVRDFIVAGDGEHPHTLDLKLRGTMPFVDGARIMALAHGISVTNTIERFRAVADADQARVAEIEAWCDAYGYLTQLRMRRQQQSERAGGAPDNRLDPDGLNELERRILKEAFRQARKLQTRIELDYQL